MESKSEKELGKQKPGKRGELCSDQVSLELLPLEILLHCLSFLDSKSLAKLLLVSKTFNRVAQDDLFWKIQVKNFLITDIEKEIFEFYFSGQEINYHGLFYKILRFKKYIPNKYIDHNTYVMPTAFDDTNFTADVLDKIFGLMGSERKEETKFAFFSQREKVFFNVGEDLGLLSIIFLAGKISEDIHEKFDQVSQTRDDLFRRIIVSIIFSQDIDEIVKYTTFLKSDIKSNYNLSIYLEVAAESNNIDVFKKILSFYSQKNTEQKQKEKLISSPYRYRYISPRMTYSGGRNFGRQAWIATVAGGSNQIIDYYFSAFDIKKDVPNIAFSIVLKEEKDVLSILCLANNKKTLEKLFSRQEIQDLVQNEENVKEAYLKAIEKGKNEVMEFFEARFDSEKLQSDLNSDNFALGIYNGLSIENVKIFFELILNQIKKQKKQILFVERCLENSIRINNPLIIEFLLEKSEEHGITFSEKTLCEMVAKTKHLGLFKKFLENCRSSDEFSDILKSCLKKSFENRRWNVAEYIFEELERLQITVSSEEALAFFYSCESLNILFQAKLYPSSPEPLGKNWLHQTTEYYLAWDFLESISLKINESEVDKNKWESYFEDCQLALFENIVKRGIPKLVEEFFEHYPAFSLFEKINKHNAVLSPFLLMFKHFNSRVIEFLLEKNKEQGDDDKLKDPEFLFQAIVYQDKEVVQLLLEIGIDRNFQRNSQITPLMLAVRLNKLEIVKLLNETTGAGSSLQVKTDEQGYTPFMKACEVGNIEMIQYLWDNNLVSPIDQNQKDEKIVRNARNHQGETALHIAAKKRSNEAILFLLKQGFDLYAEDNEGSTPYGYIYSPWIMNPSTNEHEPNYALMEKPEIYKETTFYARNRKCREFYDSPIAFIGFFFVLTAILTISIISAFIWGILSGLGIFVLGIVVVLSIHALVTQTKQKHFDAFFESFRYLFEKIKGLIDCCFSNDYAMIEGNSLELALLVGENRGTTFEEDNTPEEEERSVKSKLFHESQKQPLSPGEEEPEDDGVGVGFSMAVVNVGS